MNGKVGLSPFVIDILEKTSPTLDELVFGSTVILLLNYLIIKHLFKRDIPLWKHLLVMAISDCAFLINNFVKIYARGIYMPCLMAYSVCFFGVYIFVFYLGREKKFWPNIFPAFLMALFYTFGVIAFEGFWRVAFWAQDLSLLFTNKGVTYFRSFIIAIACALVAWLLQKLFDKRSAKK